MAGDADRGVSDSANVEPASLTLPFPATQDPKFSLPAPEESSVEIHKPKPVHGWREFLSEYAIVALGVLTALAAEQSVEWIHWQGEVTAARKTITAEIQDNNARYFARRIAVASCMDRQADEAAQILDELEAGHKTRSFTSFHIITGSLLSDSEWQSERSAQSLVHFPRDELALMGRYYGQLLVMTPWMEQETDAWQELGVLTSPPQNVGVTDILRMRVALGTARRFEQLTVLNSQRQLAITAKLGIASQPVDQQLLHKYCTSNDQEYLDFMHSREAHL
jgi:hypothetical protein